MPYFEKRLKFIVCKALWREAYKTAAESRNLVDIRLMPQGLHNEPNRLRRSLAEAIKEDKDENGNTYDAILLGYGLCSNGVVGLKADKVPLVIPRAHDCITLLLGSKEKYKEYFDTHEGVYWYSPGWIETSTQPGRERYETTYNEYVRRYGKDNAEYLMEMEQRWYREYKWATYVDWGFPKSEDYRRYTKECAEYLNWNYDEVKGDDSLLSDLVNGNWDEKRFLVVSPGQSIAADVNSSRIMKAE